MPCRVLLADDHQIVRQGLRALLEKAGHTVVGEAADGARTPDPAAGRRGADHEVHQRSDRHYLQDCRVASQSHHEEARHSPDRRAGALRHPARPGPPLTARTRSTPITSTGWRGAPESAHAPLEYADERTPAESDSPQGLLAA